MILSTGLRKLTLTAHITFSVGWLGSVAVFLALSIAGVVSKDPETVRAAYIAMGLTGWFVIVPAGVASLVTGLIQSLCTHWGLFRYYWIIVKLILTVVATVLLLLHMQPISYIAQVASDAALSDSELYSLRIRLIADAGAALFVLLIATVLSVYKPWGRTGFGLSNQQGTANQQSSKSWGKYIIYILLGLFLLFVILHLAGGGLGHH